MNDCYSPNTLEHIATITPAEWMGRAGIAAPVYNPQTQGCFWRNGAWEVVAVVPASAAVPQTVTMRQARLALLNAGKLAAANTTIGGMTGAAGDAARIEWEFSGSVERNRPLTVSLGTSLGLTSAQLDDLFRQAATL